MKDHPTALLSQRPVQLVLETALYALSMLVGYSLVPAPMASSVWWPPIGALVAWLLLRPRREWPILFVLALATRLAFALPLGRSPLLAGAVELASAVGAVVSALVLQRAVRGRRLLTAPNDIIVLVTVGLFVTGPVVTVGLVLVGLTMGRPALGGVEPLLWLLGDALGALLIIPFLLTLREGRDWWRRARASRRAELVGTIIASVILSAVFGLASPDASQWERPFLVVVVVPPAYAALRLGLFAVAWVQLLTTTCLGWGLAHGLGVMSSMPTSPGFQVLTLQAELLMGIVGIMLIAAAFDSQRRALRLARASEAQFRQLVDNTPVAILVERSDAPDRPYVNPRLAALFGTVDEGPGLDAWWARTGVMPTVRAALDEAAATPIGPVPPLMTDLRGLDGSTRHVELNVSVVGDRRITTFTDLTERVRLEGELRQAHKLEALGTLAGGVAHDFNNLLAAMLGHVDLARRTLPPNAEALAFLTEADRAGMRAASVVRQILTFSRREEQSRHVLSLGAILHEAVGVLRGVAGRGVQITVSASPDVPMILGDSTQLHQLIVNLGQNALHAMRNSGGTLSLELSTRVVMEAEARRRPELREGRYARLVVRDTGHGMAQETIERIFEPFFTTKQVGEGTGLGLAVVHGVVRSHDGAIMATSAVSAGTTFEVLLPAVTTPASTPVIVPEVTPSGRGLRVLVVDDEPALVRIAERSLVRAGCTVRAVPDGASALDVLREDAAAIDVLVTDLTMPGMTGLQLSSEARRLRADLPVLLVSGYSAMLSVDTVRADGIAAILPKPYTPDELVRAVTGLVPEAASRN